MAFGSGLRTPQTLFWFKPFLPVGRQEALSSGSASLPAILKAKEKGKRVEYIGFSHKPSVAMVANYSVSRLLTREDLLEFVEKK